MAKEEQKAQVKGQKQLIASPVELLNPQNKEHWAQLEKFQRFWTENEPVYQPTITSGQVAGLNYTVTGRSQPSTSFSASAFGSARG